MGGANQAEVSEFDLVVIADQHIVGLDVTVHHAGLVRKVECLEHRAHHRTRGVWRHGTAFPQQFPQRPTGNQFHDEEDVVALVGVVHALVEDIHQARVVQSGHCAGLTFETGPECRFRGIFRIHHLRGEVTVQPGVHAVVDHRHATVGDGFADTVTVVQQVSCAQ